MFSKVFISLVATATADRFLADTKTATVAQATVPEATVPEEIQAVPGTSDCGECTQTMVDEGIRRGSEQPTGTFDAKCLNHAAFTAGKCSTYSTNIVNELMKAGVKTATDDFTSCYCPTFQQAGAMYATVLKKLSNDQSAEQQQSYINTLQQMPYAGGNFNNFARNFGGGCSSGLAGCSIMDMMPGFMGGDFGVGARLRSTSRNRFNMRNRLSMRDNTRFTNVHNKRVRYSENTHDRTTYRHNQRLNMNNNLRSSSYARLGLEGGMFGDNMFGGW